MARGLFKGGSGAVVVAFLLTFEGTVVLAQFGSLSWGSPSNIGPPSRPYGKPPRPFSGGGGGGGGGGGPPPPPGGPGNGGGGGGGGGPPIRGDYNDDPIPPMHDGGEGSYDTQQLPAKLPILAPNGVVEIYNRVVDDLLRKLEVDLQRKDLDPMSVVIRPTPPGPVRVPGYLQKRPFRRPGAALYRSTHQTHPAPLFLSPPSSSSSSGSKTVRQSRSSSSSDEAQTASRFGNARPSSDGESSTNSFRGVGKISKTPLSDAVDDDEKELMEPTPSSSVIVTPTTTTTQQPSSTSASEVLQGVLPAISISSEERGSSEEEHFIKPRSDEFFPEAEDEEDQDDAKVGGEERRKEKREESAEEDEDEDGANGKEKDVDSLMQHYQSKNAKPKEKYGKGGKGVKPVVVDPSDEEEQPQGHAQSSGEKQVPPSSPSSGGKSKTKKEEAVASRRADTKKTTKTKNKKRKEKESEEKDSDEEEDDEPEERGDNNDEEFDEDGPEPGTGGGKRPNGGFYPPGGPPAVPAKPNAELTGLSRIRRASDVSVSVDARSAVITARLLVGPVNVVINDSIEPMEKNVKATIPELEAELLLMERHGVVFLQRFTLDRAYGQDVEISIPKSNKDKSKKNSSNLPPSDPNHPLNVETRRQTKMAAHVSMEVVKLLRSGNLRVNLMRTAQGAMSKLKLPIKKAKKSGGKSTVTTGGVKSHKKKGKKHSKTKH